jgi:hypothetical protein
MRPLFLRFGGNEMDCEQQPIALPPVPETVEAKHGVYILRDEGLKKIEEALVLAYEAERKNIHEYNGIRRVIDQLERERKKRVDLLVEPGPLHKRPVSNKPNAKQQQAIETFVMIAEGSTDAKMIDGMFGLLKHVKAHQTNWKNARDESVVAIYERRMRAAEQGHESS